MDVDLDSERLEVFIGCGAGGINLETEEGRLGGEPYLALFDWYDCANLDGGLEIFIKWLLFGVKVLDFIGLWTDEWAWLR